MSQTSDNNNRIAKNTFFRMLFLIGCIVVYEAMFIARILKSQKITMTEQQYNEFLKAYTKEALASMIKADIHNRFPEPYASMYCQQFDNFKNVADFFEFAAKLMKR